MTPEEFIAKWSETTTKERASAQSHFNDLCRLLGEKTPHEADPTGEWYAFEKGVEKTGLGRGWADVWKRGCFGWEYKSKSGGRISTMQAALRQLQLYSLALESPPLLIVSDFDTIEIHTAFQNAVQERHVMRLDELADPDKRQLLKWAFDDPERLRPKRTRNQITAEAAGQFADLAFQLRDTGHEPHKVAHFLNKLLFCMFAEDAGLLRSNMFSELTETGVEHPEHFDTFLKQLFRAMQTGGSFGREIIDWFNGGLFDGDETIPLRLAQIRRLRDLAHMDWSQIEPAIFGTLFERGLDPSKRSQLGAHYTDPQSIMRLVNPTIVEPLLERWRATKAVIAHEMERMEKVKSPQARKNRLKAAEDAFFGYLEMLRNFRVLDPACGSGNFLYLSLQALKSLEHRANVEAEALGLRRQNPVVGPEAVQGIELNGYAAELARVTVWIGEIQWMLSHGYSLSKNPILKPLDNIEQRDAVLQHDGTEPDWPKADVIVGNPPFLGDKKMLRELGDDYVESLRSLYRGRVPGGADLVTYWFEKARWQLEQGKTDRVGLVATNSIRGGRSKQVLNRVAATGRIYEAWSDEPWINEGAAVRVSLICFTHQDTDLSVRLNAKSVPAINSDLTPRKPPTRQQPGHFDTGLANRLQENSDVSFQGVVLIGEFDVDGDLAREWLTAPNPNGRPNSDVLRPLVNGSDIMRKSRGRWVIDFATMDREEACLYELPFAHVFAKVRPARESNPRKNRRERWWIHGETGSGWRDKTRTLPRYIATSQVAKHRCFVWQHSRVWPHQTVIAFARADDQTMGILQSRFHLVWAARFGTSLEDRPRYTPTTTFETFPFPAGLTPVREGALINAYADQIARAASNLTKLRDSWLFPPEWVIRTPEIVPDYPDHFVPKEGHEADLSKRTLTNLYNQQPEWLSNAHQELDNAVAAAYGWPVDLSDDDILWNLLELNLSRTPVGAASRASKIAERM